MLGTRTMLVADVLQVRRKKNLLCCASYLTTPNQEDLKDASLFLASSIINMNFVSFAILSVDRSVSVFVYVGIRNIILV